MALTFGPPLAGAADTDATLFPETVMPVFVHEYERASPAARNGIVVPHVVPASVTVTLLRATSPVLVTVLTKLAVPPDGTICPGLVLVPAGPLVISMLGVTTGTVTSSV